MAGESVSFDRAAAFYDATRGRAAEGVAAETDTLVAALRGLGPVLEIGVGTGQIAIPVARAGVPVIGLDLSAAMLAVLVDKAGGSPPFPLLRGDATALPIRDLAVGAAMFRWVLHLIPSWPDAVAELVRVVRPGGVVLALLGGYPDGPRGRIQERFAAATGVDRRPAGLGWEDYDALDEAFARHGGRASWLPAFEDRETTSVEEFMVALEENRYSWTWPLADEDRRRAATEVRAWAEAELGPLDAIEPARYEVRWRVYRLP
jgi:ubiquinone/menaquinone biosynthesis C-methylase UbiE